MSYFSGPPSKRQFFEYLQRLLNKISLIDVGDHEILLEKVQLALMKGISWEVEVFSGKRGVYANSLSGPFKGKTISSLDPDRPGKRFKESKK